MRFGASLLRMLENQLIAAHVGSTTIEMPRTRLDMMVCLKYV